MDIIQLVTFWVRMLSLMMIISPSIELQGRMAETQTLNFGPEWLVTKLNINS